MKRNLKQEVARCSADVVFHGSPNGGLKSIEPHISSHGKAYVYATKEKALSLLFLAQWNDFILNVAYGDDAVLEITERYPNAFEAVYRNKAGYLYELASDNFAEGLTGFDGEVVSAAAEPVLKETCITNLYDELYRLIDSHQIRLRKYPERHPDIPDDDSDLVKEAIYLYNQGHKNAIELCITLHPALKDRFTGLS